MQFSIVDVASVKVQSILRNLDLKSPPKEFNIPQKTLTSWAKHDKTLQETITFADKRLQRLQKQTTNFSYSDPGGTLENIN